MSTAPRRALPRSTYRLQLHAGFGFDDAAAAVDHVADLGVSHLYLSPVLQAVEGSLHGYDVLDHSRLSGDLGGDAAFDRLVAAAHRRGLGIVADVVPNHMAVPTPESANPVLWSVLSGGRRSPYADWVDVDWAAGQGRLLMAVLGSPLREVLAAGELAVADDGPGGSRVIRYHDHVFPVAEATGALALPALLDAQHHRLAWWQVADAELDYRRFFDVDTLMAIRVEDPAVFDATHEVLLDRFRAGDVDGFRIDHPDGLADPRGYLARLAAATDGAWVVVEKIVEHGEELPADWSTAGTTGYDALHQVQGLFVDPAGTRALLSQWHDLTGDVTTWAEVVQEAKRLVATRSLAAEVSRLVGLAVATATADRRDLTDAGLRAGIVELLVAFEVYRGYVVPGEPAPAQAVEVVHAARDVALGRAPRLATEITFLVELALGTGEGGTCTGVATGRDPARDEFCIRFQQTAGPVMAKGVEDTAFYRWYPLSALTEVGGDPSRVGVEPDAFAAWSRRQAVVHPAGMTTLTTHDTKRSEDTRARLLVLSEVPDRWAAAVARWRAASAAVRPASLDGATESLFWQSLYAASPWGARGALPADRLHGYLAKATREAKVRTTWTSPDELFEAGLRSFTDAVLADRALLADMGAFADSVAPAVRAVVLGQKLVQLTMPGVPDVYQGTEILDLSLVDPDNRRPVDYADRRARLAHLDGGGAPRDLDDEKLRVTSAALRLRAEAGAAFTGPHTALATGTPHAVAFLRGQTVATVVTRFAAALGTDDGAGGFGGAVLSLPAGPWTDVLTGRTVQAGPAGIDLAGLLDRLPVALLRRTD